MRLVRSYNNSGEMIEVRKVDKSTPDFINDYTASSVLSIMRAAYIRIAQQSGAISHRAASDHFEPTKRHVDRQVERIQQNILRNGSSYYFAYSSNTDMEIPIGMAKTSPSRPGFKKLFGKPNLFLNDIAVKRAGQRVGTVLHHAVLDSYNFDERGPVSLDAIKADARTTRLYVSVGYVALEDVPTEPVRIGGETLETVRMEAPGLTVVKAKLEEAVPWLAGAA